MEKLKDLSNICEPDPRQGVIVVIDPTLPNGSRQITLEDRYNDMVELDLPENIPENLRSAFAVARNIWLYGWFHWPFYTLASFEAYRCIEMALHQRCENEGIYTVLGKKRSNVGLRWLINQAVQRNWLQDQKFKHFQRSEDKRKEMSYLSSGLFDTTILEEFPGKKYCKILADTIPSLRNFHAHQDAYSHGMPGSSYLDLELARDIIIQLFPCEGTKIQ